MNARMSGGTEVGVVGDFLPSSSLHRVSEKVKDPVTSVTFATPPPTRSAQRDVWRVLTFLVQHLPSRRLQPNPAAGGAL